MIYQEKIEESNTKAQKERVIAIVDAFLEKMPKVPGHAVFLLSHNDNAIIPITTGRNIWDYATSPLKELHRFSILPQLIDLERYQEKTGTSNEKLQEALLYTSNLLVVRNEDLERITERNLSRPTLVVAARHLAYLVFVGTPHTNRSAWEQQQCFLLDEYKSHLDVQRGYLMEALTTVPIISTFQNEWNITMKDVAKLV